MKQGSTCPLMLTIPGVDLTAADWVVVSLKPPMKPAMEFNRERLSIGADDSGTAIALTLTQAESLALGGNVSVSVDCNWMLDGVRRGTYMANVDMRDTLLKRVVGGE